MSSSSRTDSLALMRAVNPVSAEALREAIGEPELLGAMRRAIAVGQAPPRPIPAGDRVALERGAGGVPGRDDARGAPRRSRIFSRRRVASLAFGLACVAVIAVLVVLGGGSVDTVKEGGRPTYAAAAVKVAEANPRLLITAPGWSIIHANITAEDGGLTYSLAGHPYPGPYAAVMNWAPAGLYREALRGLGRHGTVTHSTVLGRRVATFHERGGAYDTVFPPQDDVFVTLSLPPAEHEALLRSVRAVSVDRWLAAMPPEVVQPAAESAVIAAMLNGVPLPPGFDLAALEAEGELSNRFDLGRTVAGAVACGWLGSWSAATRSGDDAVARQAVEGMSGARRWPVLLQMVQEKGFEGDVLPAHGNGWPSYIVEASREIEAGHLRRRPAVHKTYENGAVFSVGIPGNVAPASVLGCHLGG
ncbi:MAG TPA: hypothetical protein VN671_04090 [Solirubrobacterales bacterium]|nr:hypothetical protein [Solirubrobacterales bacterium]